MKFYLILTALLFSSLAPAVSNCDIQLGETVGVQVVEFSTGNIVHSKMSLKESSPQAILEEMVNLQDMGVCTEKILAKKCVLRFEQRDKKKAKELTLYRGEDRWHSWMVESKNQAQDFVKNLKRLGFCS
jgi:hypothetical protein